MGISKEYWAKHREEMKQKIKDGRAKAKENREIKKELEVKT
jgi:hypothetical protein